MRSTWLVLGAGLCGFALSSSDVDPSARIAAFAVLVVAAVLDRRRALVIAGAALGLAAGARIEAPMSLADVDPSASVPVVVVLDEAIVDGRSHGWVRTPGRGPVRARITGLGEEAGGPGTRIAGTARLRDLARRATPDRRAAGRGAAARGARVGVAFREARIDWRAPAGWKSHWSRALDDRLGASSGLWRALSVADAHALDPGARAAVQGMGMAHLLALSGMHTAIVAAVLLWPWRRYGRRGLLFVLPVLVLWAVAAGAGPSLVRAVGMAGWWVVARWRGRRADVTDGLAVTALCELALRPQLLCGVGWWLSYSATLAVIRAAIATRTWPRLASAVAVSSAAQCATLPWVVDAFGFVNLLAPVALLLVGPVFGVALTVGLLGLVVGSCVPLLTPWTDALTIGAGHLFGLALRIVAPASGCSVWGPGFDGGNWTAMLAAVAVVLWPVRVRGRIRAILVIPLLGAAALTSNPDHEWVLFDVGQGDGAVLRCGDDALVIDAGPRYGDGAPASWTMVDWLRRRGLDKLRVVVTHGHLDHSGGLGVLLGEGLVGEVFLARADSGTTWAGRVAEACARAGVAMRWVARGDTLAVGHCRAAVLWPPGPATELHANDRSVVLSWEVAGGRALSAGDLERPGERGLGAPGPHRWLKVAHHGGDTGTDAAFLEELRPVHALVCCGAGNRYGHPSPALLARLSAAGARIHRTDRCGYLRLRWMASAPEASFDCGRAGCP